MLDAVYIRKKYSDASKGWGFWKGVWMTVHNEFVTNLWEVLQSCRAFKAIHPTNIWLTKSGAKVLQNQYSWGSSFDWLRLPPYATEAERKLLRLNKGLTLRSLEFLSACEKPLPNIKIVVDSWNVSPLDTLRKVEHAYCLNCCSPSSCFVNCFIYWDINMECDLANTDDLLPHMKSEEKSYQNRDERVSIDLVWIACRALL